MSGQLISLHQLDLADLLRIDAHYAKLNDDELNAKDFESAGILPDTIVRINEHGDIEVRRPAGWDVIGGLLGEYNDRLRKQTGMEWA